MSMGKLIYTALIGAVAAWALLLDTRGLTLAQP